MSDPRGPVDVRELHGDIAGGIAEEFHRYDDGGGQPLPAYAATMATYGASVTALAALAWRRRGGRLPTAGLIDIALTGVATFKLSRVLAKDAVTSPLRAPFTTYEGDADTPAEVMEKPRDGSHLRHTVGELLSCPFCLSQWVGSLLTFGMVVAPRGTRLVTGALASITAADFLQFAYVAAEKKTS